MDEDKEYARYLLHASPQFFQCFPSMRNSSTQLIRSLYHVVQDHEDRAHFVTLMERVYYSRSSQYNKRCPSRRWACVSEQVTLVLREARALAILQKQPTIRSVLPRHIDRAGVLDFIARCLLRSRHGAQKPRRRGYKSAPEMVASILCAWMSSGVFEPVIPMGVGRVSHHELDARVRAQQAEQPALMIPEQPNGGRVSRCSNDLTPEMVRVCEQHVKTLREKLYVEMAKTTALRASAFSGLLVDDVWEASGGKCKSEITVLEKNSLLHTVVVSDKAKQLIPEYLEREHRFCSPYLFYNKHHKLKQPGPDILKAIIRGICKRAEIPIFRHHSWRHHLVVVATENGCSLEMAAAALGHTDVSVTARCYMQPSVVSYAELVRPRTTGPSDTDHESVLCDLITSLEVLEHENTKRSQNNHLVEQLTECVANLQQKCEALERDNKKLSKRNRLTNKAELGPSSLSQ